MRLAMGMGENDRVPAPTMFTIQGVEHVPELSTFSVPNWVTLTDPCNGPVSLLNIIEMTADPKWVDRMTAELLEEVANGDHHQIPPEDLNAEVVKVTHPLDRSSFRIDI